MAAKYTPQLRTFVASGLIDSIKSQAINEWESQYDYIEGDVVFYGNNKYVCKETGTSGAIPPIHINGSETDGGISWIWVESINVHEMYRKNVFMFIGKRTPWTDEDLPDDIEVSEATNYDTIQNIMTLKKLSNSNMRLAIKRYNWLSGQVYSSFDDHKDPLKVMGPEAYEHPFYIFTDENNIYKCIDNNNGAVSTVKPIAIQNTPFLLGDGYVWKYMGSLDIDSVFFLTKDFIPVKFKKVNDGSTQWSVQTTAKPKSISSFKILAKYGTFPDAVSVSISGGTPTTPAAAYATKNPDETLRQLIVYPNQVGEGYDIRSEVIAIAQRAGSVGSGAAVTNITLDVDGTITDIDFSAGTGYTDAIVLLVDTVEPSEPAILDVEIISGSVSQINITNGGLGYSENVRGFIIPGVAGAVAKAVFAPKHGHGSNIVDELCANNVIVNMMLTESTDYLLVGEDNAFRQVGLITDVVEINTLNPAFNSIYMGPGHPGYASPSYNRIDSNTGFVLYLNNKKKTVRVIGQEENINIAITL